MMAHRFVLLSICCALAATMCFGACLDDDGDDTCADTSAFVQSTMQVRDRSSGAPLDGVPEGPGGIRTFAGPLRIAWAIVDSLIAEAGRLAPVPALERLSDAAQENANASLPIITIGYTATTGDDVNLTVDYDHGCTKVGENGKSCMFMPGETIKENIFLVLGHDVESEAESTTTVTTRLGGVLKSLFGKLVEGSFTVKCAACGESCVDKLPRGIRQLLHQVPSELLEPEQCPIDAGKHLISEQTNVLPTALELGLINVQMTATQDVVHKNGTLLYRLEGIIGIGPRGGGKGSGGQWNSTITKNHI